MPVRVRLGRVWGEGQVFLLAPGKPRWRKFQAWGPREAPPGAKEEGGRKIPSSSQRGRFPGSPHSPPKAEETQKWLPDPVPSSRSPYCPKPRAVSQDHPSPQSLPGLFGGFQQDPVWVLEGWQGGRWGVRSGKVRGLMPWTPSVIPTGPFLVDLPDAGGRCWSCRPLPV